MRTVSLMCCVLILAAVSIALPPVSVAAQSPDAPKTPTPPNGIPPTQTPWVITATPPAVAICDGKTKCAQNTPIPVYLVPPLDGKGKLTTLEIPGLALVSAPDGYSSLPPVLEAIDAALQPIWDQVVDVQTAYFAASQGRYIQGLPSHGDAPANGHQTYPDHWFFAPSDFPASWEATGMLPFSLWPFNARIDVYDGVWGPGFVLCITHVLGGSTWEKCLNYGGELWRSHGWEQLTNVEPPP